MYCHPPRHRPACAEGFNGGVDKRMRDDVTADSPEFEAFVKAVFGEMTSKAGQKCTAIRRAIVPHALRASMVASNVIPVIPSDLYISRKVAIGVGMPESSTAEAVTMPWERCSSDKLEIPKSAPRIL